MYYFICGVCYVTLRAILSYKERRKRIGEDLVSTEDVGTGAVGIIAGATLWPIWLAYDLTIGLCVLISIYQED